MICNTCKNKCVDDYYTIDAKRITKEGLATVPTYILCPECYNKLIKAIKELDL